MKRLSKKSKPHFERTEKPIEAWQLMVEFRALSGRELRDLQAEMRTGKFNDDPITRQASMIADCVDEFESVEQVLEWPFEGIEELALEIMAFSGAPLAKAADGVDPDELRAQLEDEMQEQFDEAEGNSSEASD